MAIIKKEILCLSMFSSSGERGEVSIGEEGVTTDLLSLAALLLASVVAKLLLLRISASFRVVVVTVVGVDIVVVVVVEAVDDFTVVEVVTLLGVVTSWSTVWLMARTAIPQRLVYTARSTKDKTRPNTATILVPVFKEK